VERLIPNNTHLATGMVKTALIFNDIDAVEDQWTRSLAALEKALAS
jgi:hypothetical protein